MTEVKTKSVFFSFFFLFKGKWSRNWNAFFHFGFDHGLQFESYVKSTCWLLQVEKGHNTDILKHQFYLVMVFQQFKKTERIRIFSECLNTCSENPDRAHITTTLTLTPPHSPIHSTNISTKRFLRKSSPFFQNCIR